MNCPTKLLWVLPAVLLAGATQAMAVTTPVLGGAQDFAVLGHTTVTNTGPSVIYGSADVLSNVGVYSSGGANATTGFSSAGNTFVGPGTNSDGPGIVQAPAAIHYGSPTANAARDDVILAYDALRNYGTASNISGQVLGDGVGGVIPVLTAGIYSFDTSAQLNGTLQLDAGGLNGGVWVFQIGTTLTTASASAIQLINAGDQAGADIGVYWVVGTSATLGTTTAFEGNILALESITMNTGASLYNGRALAINGAVTLDTNFISNICPPESSSPNTGPGFSGGLGFDETGAIVMIPVDDGNPNVSTPVPEPAAAMLSSLGFAALMCAFFRRSRTSTMA